MVYRTQEGTVIVKAWSWLVVLATTGMVSRAAAQPTGAPADPPAGTVPAPDPALEPAAPADAEAAAPAEAPSAPVEAAEAAPAADAGGGWGDLSSLEGEAPPTFRTKLYGFIDFHLEKVARTPDSVDANGDTVYVRNPYEVDVTNLNVMIQGAIHDRYRYFLNLAAPGSGSNADDEALVVRNAWIELPVVPTYLNLRVGKTYRRYGLYNEILDAVPTFIGIEAPELFDKDHLLVTRTTSVMVHGTADLGPAVVNYSATTGNDERDDKAVPFGADVYVDFPFGLRVGSSFYTTGGDAVPSQAVGDGSPRGGVVNWMTSDRYLVAGGYAQYERGGLLLQAEAWDAKHDAERDPDALAVLAAEGDLNQGQLDRFFVGGDPAAGANFDASYHVRTFYLRGGYELALGSRSSVTPYFQLDYYSNPETINNKDLGGDNEAGLTDDGRFEKYTVGAVYRPVSQVALKVDGSGHRQDFNGKSEFYPEIRISLSYLWELGL
jgi:hypothetical protein